jgi:NadR type nicotinamide-nucleotide adenylyltransferase
MGWTFEMTRAFVLMTAMPPTKGHAALIEFATHVANEVVVVVNTQPDEPYVKERVRSLQDRYQIGSRVRITNIHQTLPQEPEDDPGFWPMWMGFLSDKGFRFGDYIVASEKYGKTLADKAGGVFIPFDMDRTFDRSKATSVRDYTRQYFSDILPEFQPYLRQRVTIFGAESTGKTTLAETLGRTSNLDGGGHFVFEWARPYMENFEPEVTTQVMINIWTGQRALQKQAAVLKDKAFVVQDTDLFSTVGYWDMWTSKLGAVPDGLIEDATADKSDLYIITRSNIPFEPDPLRFGGDKREGSDEYWIGVAEKYNLNYVILDSSDRYTRLDEAFTVLDDHWDKTVHMQYHRKGKEYRK